MIITPHLLVGAAIGKTINSYLLVAVFSFISHYLVDLIPHKEYEISAINERDFSRKMVWDFVKLGVDFLPGFLIGAYLSGNNFGYVLTGMIFAILPDVADGLKRLVGIFNPDFLSNIHDKTHFWKKKMPPVWLRVFTQLAVSIIAIWILIS